MRKLAGRARYRVNGLGYLGVGWDVIDQDGKGRRDDPAQRASGCYRDLEIQRFGTAFVDGNGYGVIPVTAVSLCGNGLQSGQNLDRSPGSVGGDQVDAAGYDGADARDPDSELHGGWCVNRNPTGLHVRADDEIG